MTINNISVSNVAGSAFNTVREGVHWFGHRVVELTRVSWETGKNAIGAVVATVQWIWRGMQPLFSKIHGFMKSPAGIASIFAFTAGFCVKKSDEVEDPAGKVGLAALGLGCAFVAGIVAGCAYLA